MPDLTIEVAYTCCTNTHWETEVIGSKGDPYRVSYGPTPGGPYQYGWSCECKAFQYGGGEPCKHIRQVKDERCGWNEEMDPGCSPDGGADGPMCPRCGGPVDYMRVAV
jgi:hypothetical protein